MKKRIVIVALVVSTLAAGAVALYLHHRPNPGELVVQGNVDLRQVELPFKDNERIVEVLAQEGDRVQAGQTLQGAGKKTTPRALTPKASSAAFVDGSPLAGALCRLTS